MGESFDGELEFERPTKRTYRFKEKKEPAKIGILYVQQHAFSGSQSGSRSALKS